jgi:DNA-binding NarL/FixJ family response regulator
MSNPSDYENGALNGEPAQNGHQAPRCHDDCSLFSDQAWTALRDSLKLSAREVEITRYIFSDCKEKVIAEELQLSPHTVRTYCERLYRKLNVNSRVEMVVSIFNQFLHLTEDPRQLLPPVCGNRKAGQCPYYNN